MKLKIEINTREHFHARDLIHKPYATNSLWYTGETQITTCQLEEIMATKLRVLFQRRKGRDLFDMHYIYSNNLIDINLMLELFQIYCKRDGNTITSNQFHQNMLLKKAHHNFQGDMIKLLPIDALWDFEEAFEYVMSAIIPKIHPY